MAERSNRREDGMGERVDLFTSAVLLMVVVVMVECLPARRLLGW